MAEDAHPRFARKGRPNAAGDRNTDAAGGPSRADDSSNPTVTSAEFTEGRPADEYRSVLPPVDPACYSVGEEFARGGMGRILFAEDRRLGRPVAIKELIRHDPRYRKRFEREALITARLQHPSIVNVYEAGVWPSGEPFYTMHAIAGRSLGEVVASARKLKDRLALLPNVLAVVEALAYAHGKRVIHRDLKPDNVLVGAFGETVVIDWGLAKDLSRPEDSDSSSDEVPQETGAELTRVGSVMGTPAYMSPEQAHGEPADESSDIYALGAMLYFVLTGRAPYRESDSKKTVEKLRNEAPLPVEETTGVRAELAAIVRKAMAREPQDRYASAKKLAEELRRFQTGQLVGAHSYTNTELFLRWVRRNGAPVAVGMVALIVLFVIGGASLRRIVTERDRAQVARDLARQAEGRAVDRADEITLVQARTWLDRDPVASLAWLKALTPDSRFWTAARIIAADAQARGVYRLSQRHAGRVWQVVFSPDGSKLASTGDDQIVKVWDRTSGTHLELAGHEGIVRSLAFSPSGQRLASASGDGTVRLWDLGNGEGVALHGHKDFVAHVDFSPRGGLLASASWDGTVRLWDIESGESRVLVGHEDKVRHVTFSPDGQSLVSSSQDGSARIWNVADGSSRTLAGHADEVSMAAYSPDGTRFATVSVNGTVRIWEDGQARVLRGHTGIPTHVAFSPDGQTLASAAHDRTVRLWDAATGESRLLEGHTAEVLHFRFSPDGRRLASGGVDGTIRVWELETGQATELSGDDEAWILNLAFSPDGLDLASGGSDGGVRLWDLDLPHNSVLTGHRRSVLDAAFTPDGSQLVSCGFDNTVRVWDPASGSAAVLEGHDGGVRALAVSPDGSRVVSGGLDTTVRVWNLDDGSSLVLSGHEGGVEHVAFSPRGDLVASGSLDKTVRVWELPDGRVRVLRGHDGKVSRIVFSPDGRRLASASADETIRLWDLESGDGDVLA
ncbi:MAG: protein kinase, partial [Acidobacteria bacterium]|nr:protein kinase [Acidobacteriota bacterium]NIM64304.1 protein kinase [Acidobacteriota bacterium]NIO60936.1 protein kinase [Acidobacteriota bacterium]NIQ87405.1 protein kinase [Acidobacteriota bacterium]NIT12590.1 protein kinase [Acidobacteriota bacterium]